MRPGRPGRPGKCGPPSIDELTAKVAELTVRVEALERDGELTLLRRIDSTCQRIEAALGTSTTGGMSADEVEKVNARLRHTVAALKEIQ